MREQHLITTRTLTLYAGAPHACSYLPGEVAVTQFVDPALSMSVALYSELVDVGFRRSGEHVYRPRCRQCDACIPARIPAEQFAPSRQQRRVWRHNQDLQVQFASTRQTQEQFSLYRRYMAARHAGGGMDVSDPAQYQAFLFSPWSDTRSIEFRVDGRLIAVAIIDWLVRGWSAVYTYYEPGEGKRSLGVFAVLWQIEQCRRLGLPWVYLGYWIPQCAKMNYKVQFQPLEIFRQGRWQRHRANSPGTSAPHAAAVDIDSLPL